MNIKNVNLYPFRNEEHFQFFTEFKALAEKHSPEALGIEKLFPPFVKHYNTEGDVLQKLAKSAYTEKLNDADYVRDISAIGITMYVESLTYHFNPNIREATERVFQKIEHYGNIANKPRNEETAAIINLVADLREHHASDLQILNLTDWVDVLEKDNNYYQDLTRQRFSEGANKLSISTKEVRTDIDATFKSIVKLVNAFIITEGPKRFEAFVSELNQIIDKYSNKIKQRKGRDSKNDDESNDSGPILNID